MIPLLTLGLPGSVGSALIITAFMIHGLQPGPFLFEQQGRLVYGLFGAMIMANLTNLIIGLVGLRLWSRVVTAPASAIFAAALTLCFVGVYMSAGGLFAVGLMVVFAGVGYLMNIFGFSVIAFIIAFFLGPRFEQSLIQTLTIVDGKPMTLLDHPVAIALLLLALLSAYWLGVRGRRRGT